MTTTRTNVTQLLLEWSKGDKSALNDLLPLIYDELRRVAAGYLKRERPGHTLQPTALVNEAYLQLAGEKRVDWENRAHFFGAAARLMRRILIDHARSRNALKRGAGEFKETLTEALVAHQPPQVDLIALDSALDKLAALNPQQVRVVELRYIVGFSIEETAEILSLSVATVKRYWVTAQAFLLKQMSAQEK
ncbi:MAG TPA: sigma-70 family RNA polymerase sigma factor [Pyrinomonadaceae bacterium]